MQYRVLGRTGLKVSEIGFGTWGIGGSMWGPASVRDDAESIKSLIEATKLGINFFDTAYVYGDGHSERLIAEAFGKIGKCFIVATKIPAKNMMWPAKKGTPIKDAFPADWIISCTERSLKNLRLETIDLQQLHVWTDDWADKEEWQNGINKLKKDGKIRFFGVSVNDFEPESVIKLVKSGLVDSIQIIYNLLEQAPADELFPLCKELNVGVIVRVPLDEGALTGKLTPDTKFHQEDFRSRYFSGNRLKEVCEKVKKFDFLIRDDIKTLAQAALKFCLSHPAVSTVIPGMRKVSHVKENAAVSDGKYLTTDELKRAYPLAWKKNFYN